MNKVKPYTISKYVVLEAYRKIKANKGCAGIDEESIQAFECNLKDNLYKIWNRMSSGSYFPEPVKGIDIPKKTGGKRTLGIPTVKANCTSVQSLFGMDHDYTPLSSLAWSTF